jgi:hypothetical protein
MTTKEIANRLTELCRKGEFEKAQKELFADDAISIEPMATPAFEKETKGLKAIIEKGKKFDGMVQEYHSVDISQPLVTDKSIAFVLVLDITMKGRAREQMSEICVYDLKDGKIVSEQFHM